ncbi:MAG: aspartate--tRNA ligase [Armatimonadetes bacterium]|nr:aspartate--tRNA ligase [Armatimonadota bacterium]
MTHWQRTHDCGKININHVGEETVLNGWVNRNRDHGDLVFIDLRDRTGIVQVVIDAGTSPEVMEAAQSLRSEFCLSVRGRVRARREGAVNPNILTGEIEIVADHLEILSTSKALPFQVSDESAMAQVDETRRVKYRYIDLRRPKMYQMLALRHKVVTLIREFMNAEDFLEIETPIFTKSTPEGARDYLIPYRLTPGYFYALPQSPQQYKQLLMVGGVERYYQIARCFRDESQRADRQPEFTQLDLEMSFVTQEDILNLVERLITSVVGNVSEKQMLTPFPRLTWDEALRRYGSDKPDIRFGLELVDLSDIVRDSGFSAFDRILANGGQVKAIRYPNGTKLSRKEVDVVAEFCKEFGAAGMASVAVNELNAAGLKSPITKFFQPEKMEEILKACEAEVGDLLCIVADMPKTVANVLGRLRLEIGNRLGLRDLNKLYFNFVTDFPLVQWDETEKRWDAEHHPFTMPLEEHLQYFDTDPGRMRAQCYDLVCNGQESGSGSIRIHRADIQSKVFSLLGISEETQRERFGHMLDAFSFGAPPHGGFAPGIDRLLMNLLDEPNIREVMAFPKMGLGHDPMMEAPSLVDEAQMKELGLEVKPHKK